jgi:hypothetical protein
VLTLDAFEAALSEAYDKKAPNALAEHAYRLSQAFSKFYAACPIMTAAPAVARAALTLATATLRQLELALDLLGIATPGADVGRTRWIAGARTRKTLSRWLMLRISRTRPSGQVTTIRRASCWAQAAPAGRRRRSP